jgi:hypothetical protein
MIPEEVSVYLIRKGSNMKKGIKAYSNGLILFTVLILSILNFGKNYSELHLEQENNIEDIPNEETINQGNTVGLTALEAMNLAYEEVKKISDEEPLLTRLTSTDDTSAELSIYDGADGKRNAWNMNFGTASGSMNISVSIRDGIFYKGDLRIDDNNSLQKGIYSISDIKIDSTDLVKKCIELFNMKPGNPEISDDWIKGYHFVIANYTIDPYLKEEKLLLRVTGISPNSPNSNNESLRMHVFFDVKTGEVFSATEQIGYDEEGRSSWREINIE